MTATARQALDSIQRDPVGFCRTVLKFSPWSKQCEIIESVRDNRRTAVRSAHGTGKTAIAARAVLWFLAAFPHSRVITTAPTWSQVKELLWREIATGHAAAGAFFDGALTDTKLELDADWFALGLSTDRPERFSGHHAERLLLVVDEASGVDDAIFEAGEGFLTSPESRVLLIGNPTQLAGTFHRAFHSERAMWNTIAISAFDTPTFTGERVPEAVLRRLVSREWVETAQKKWGEGSPLYQVRVLGEFPATADDTVCSLSDIETAQRQFIEPSPSPVIVSCDPARFGSDETVIAVRRGNRVRIAATAQGHDTMRTTGQILRIARAEAAKGPERPVLVVDDIGLGGGITDRLREIGEFKVQPFNAASAARDPKKYPNKRSEMWFDFAERLTTIDLDDDEQLAADLVAPTYRIDSQGRRVVEAKSDTKKRLGRSPDRADAVLMSFAGTNSPRAASINAMPGGGEYARQVGDLTLRGDHHRDKDRQAAGAEFWAAARSMARRHERLR